MRSPRVVYGVVAVVLAVAGFVLPRYLADRSAPELGETVVVPTPVAAQPTPTPTVAPPSEDDGADEVPPASPRTAGQDDPDDDADDLDDDD